MITTDAGDQESAIYDFLKPGYTLAFGQLREEGSLSPFVVGLVPDRPPRCLMPKDGSPETLRKLAREALDGKKYPVVARFIEVSCSSEDKQTARALAVFLDGLACRLVLTPFTFDGSELVCGTPNILENSDPLLRGDTR